MVKVYVTNSDIEFIDKHSLESFKASELTPEDKDRVKVLADKAIFVRKKLDTDVQYALNRKIRIFRNDKVKKIGTGKTD